MKSREIVEEVEQRVASHAVTYDTGYGLRATDCGLQTAG
jgi:hypothetical protein